MRFRIEDERHSDVIGEFATEDEAHAELRRLVQVPWNEAPNRAPCTNWKDCGRDYELVEYDPDEPHREIARRLVLTVSANGVDADRCIASRL